jgi:hypothetical protein
MSFRIQALLRHALGSPRGKDVHPTSGITPRKAGNTGSRILHPAPAAGAGEALPPAVQTIEPHGIPGAAPVVGAAVVRGLRHVTDRLVVLARLLVWTPLTGHPGGMSRSLWWVQLSEQPTWLVLVVDKAGEPIGGGIELENDQVDALAGVAEYLLPSDAGPMRLTIRDQAGEEIAAGLGYDSIKGLAALAESLLPSHPG